MGFFQGVVWLGWVFSIFDGFTFTDWYDFLPLGCLLVGIGSAVRTMFCSVQPASLWLKGALGALALWPLLPTATLVMLALQVVRFDGHWPQVMVDDPKNKVGLWPRYDFWFHATSYAEAFAGAALFSFVLLLSVNRKRLSQRALWNIIALCGAAIIVSILDPGGLSEWWLD